MHIPMGTYANEFSGTIFSLNIKFHLGNVLHTITRNMQTKVFHLLSIKMWNSQVHQGICQLYSFENIDWRLWYISNTEYKIHARFQKSRGKYSRTLFLVFSDESSRKGNDRKTEINHWEDTFENSSEECS